MQLFDIFQKSEILGLKEKSSKTLSVNVLNELNFKSLQIHTDVQISSIQKTNSRKN